MENPDGPNCHPPRCRSRPPSFKPSRPIMRVPSALLRLATRFRNVARQLWLLPETRPLVTADTMCLAVNVAELLFAAARPCVMSSMLYDETCGNSMLILQIIAIVKAVLMSGLVNNCIQPRLAVACTHAGLKLPLGDKLKQVPTRGWAAASSVEVFQEVVRVARESQIQLLVFLAFATSITSASFIAADLAASESPEYQAYFAEVCKDCNVAGWSAEWMAWKWRETIAIIVASLAAYPSSLMLALRIEMWSPVFMDAVTRTNARWLKRSLHSLLWTQFIIGLGTIYVFAIGVKLKLMTATHTDMLGFTWVSIFCLTLGLANMVWTTGLDVAVLQYFKSSRVMPQPEISLDITTDSSLSIFSVFSNDAAPEIRKQDSKLRLSGLAVSSKASFKQRQLQILINMSLLLLGTPFASWVTVAAVWFTKLVTIFMVLMTHDPTYTMDQLKLAEPGFGMLVNAGHFRAALQAFLSGSTYSGPLEKTRGSYYCMDDALTVSYRWQDEEVEVCPGLSLNMSRWQMSELEKAIGRSCCIYVWVDKLALPQDESRLQRTLLSRMMAVYASSRQTLAMRSLEANGSRYHQRAWTLQELCNAREVEVVTQPSTEEAGEAGVLAVANGEDSMFPGAREWHQGRASQCRPYWLSGLNMGDIDVSIERYKSISKQVFCKYTADKVRALYPMIFNTPCEDESEIMSLVVDVAYSVTRACDPSKDKVNTNPPPLHSGARNVAVVELPEEVKEAMPEEAIQFLLLVKSKSSPGALNYDKSLMVL